VSAIADSLHGAALAGRAACGNRAGTGLVAGLARGPV